MDFITNLLKCSEANCILIIIHRFNKIARFILITLFLKDSKEKKIEIILKMMISLFFDCWIYLNGVSTTIVNNKDVKFVTQFW